jgi:hypothetical protein
MRTLELRRFVIANLLEFQRVIEQSRCFDDCTVTTAATNKDDLALNLTTLRCWLIVYSWDVPTRTFGQSKINKRHAH